MKTEKPPDPKSEPIQEATQANKQDTKGEADETASHPVVNPLNPETDEPYSREREEETDRKQDDAISTLAKRTDWIETQTKWLKWQVITSSILGAVTLGVLVYHGILMGRQWQAMNATLRQTEIATDAAKRSTQIADESLRYSQAAYLTVQAASLDEPLRVGQPAKATITFVNAGNTPAYAGHAAVHIGLFSHEPTEPIPPLTPEQKMASEFIAGPKIPFNHQAVNKSTVLTPHLLSQIQAQLLHVYVMGRIEYRDVFDHERWITFCFVQNPPPSLLLTACTNNNKAN